MRELRGEFWQQRQRARHRRQPELALERAGRVADFIEFGELLALDAWTGESRAAATSAREYQTADGEANRNDDALRPRRRLGVGRPKTSRAGMRRRMTPWPTSSSSMATAPRCAHSGSGR